MPKAGLAVSAGLVLLLLAALPHSLLMRAVLVASTLLTFGCVTWFWGLAPEERAFVLRIRPRVLQTPSGPPTAL
jgi:hypothetical protein